MIAATAHGDVNDLLSTLLEGAREVVGDGLVALWLTGSLTYGDFDRGSSDIDYVAVLSAPLDPLQRNALTALHRRIAARWPEWAERIEGSWIPRDWPSSIDPPTGGRPYVNGGAFWNPDPPYGNEWLVNLYALRETGVALAGPEPRVLIPPVDIAEVRWASSQDLHEEWVPMLDDRELFASSHHQAYVTLTICRILHRAQHEEVASKRVAAEWVRARYPDSWLVDLVGRAERWQHGDELDAANEVRRFIVFAREQVPR